ncbi:MAG: DUF2322 family protein [Sulfuricellaceae bacterium]|nr:DUF2322 family protein [Sulfuricellaceae bacterium]
MKTFAENLATLESVDHLASLALFDAHGAVVASIENKPGSQGSLKLYYHLAKKWGSLNAEAAAEGLALYAEHTEDALSHPGKHPNIDRLAEIQQSKVGLSVRVFPPE